MEIRFRSIFLAIAWLVVFFPVGQLSAQSSDEEETESLIEPQIEREEFDESKIESQDFEIAVYGGYLGIDNFETDFVAGIKLGYHISEDLFIQFDFGQGDAGQTSFEKLSGGAPLLSGAEREIEYYLFSLGFNILPGESFVTDSTTFNTIFYVSGGVGTTEFAGDERFTIVYGLGYRILFADAISFDIEMRDLIMEQDLFGEDETSFIEENGNENDTRIAKSDSSRSAMSDRHGSGRVSERTGAEFYLEVAQRQESQAQRNDRQCRSDKLLGVLVWSLP